MANRRKQKALPGMEPETIAEIDAASELYEELRDKRMRALAREVEAKDALTELMRKYKLSVYKDRTVDPPLVVSLKEGTSYSVKVERVQPKADDAEEPGEQ